MTEKTYRINDAYDLVAAMRDVLEGETDMPMMTVTLKVTASFREEGHRESIVDAIKQSGEQVLTNIGMLSPANSRIPPQVTMKVVVAGEDDREYNIANEMVAKYTYDADEDPFA